MMFRFPEIASQKHADSVVRMLDQTALDAVVFYYGKIYVSVDDYWVETCYSESRI